ncbi:hypothetical protein EI546_06445 [Aequorivita sp. H23M31]|uniref:Uncharacterized protein n=1 Tax=Aequorivita ciconiae TaxID=2494375 RepID=A0A410G2B5_9FLAO|nr:hypothetical protein [Aequorivita sp. H23M31]QAA81389.1 hypothetical protein EI546_06445 [Aequorivita sp. H23M31]
MHETIHIEPSLTTPNTWFLFREDGTELKVWLYQDELMSKRQLSKAETAFLNEMIKPSKINI